MHLIAFFIWEPHFWEFFFAPHAKPFWEGAVWGNVVAVLPLAILGVAGFIYHHYTLKQLHESHDRHLKKIIDALDPETDTDTQIDQIYALVDDKQPGGITVVLDTLEKRLPPPT